MTDKVSSFLYKPKKFEKKKIIEIQQQTPTPIVSLVPSNISTSSSSLTTEISTNINTNNQQSIVSTKTTNSNNENIIQTKKKNVEKKFIMNRFKWLQEQLPITVRFDLEKVKTNMIFPFEKESNEYKEFLNMIENIQFQMISLPKEWNDDWNMIRFQWNQEDYENLNLLFNKCFVENYPNIKLSNDDYDIWNLFEGYVYPSRVFNENEKKWSNLSSIVPTNTRQKMNDNNNNQILPINNIAKIRDDELKSNDKQITLNKKLIRKENEDENDIQFPRVTNGRKRKNPLSSPSIKNDKTDKKEKRLNMIPSIKKFKKIVNSIQTKEENQITIEKEEFDRYRLYFIRFIISLKNSDMFELYKRMIDILKSFDTTDKKNSLNDKSQRPIESFMSK